MATFDYVRMQNITTSLLKKFGNKFVLRKVTGSQYDHILKKQVTTTKDFSGVCVMKSYTDETVGQMNNLVNIGDVTFVCSFDDKDVKAEENKDKVIYNGIAYNVLDVTVSNPSGEKTLVYFLHSRKA